jgi:pimeloyl-ACP methyl ester carboxylesterase
VMGCERKSTWSSAETGVYITSLLRPSSVQPLFVIVVGEILASPITSPIVSSALSIMSAANSTATLSSKPHIVLIHGAWHGPQHLTSITEYLTSHGYTCSAPHLPSSHAEDPTTVTLQDDITTVRTHILSLLRTANVCVVAHSYGTTPTTASLSGLDTASRQADGHSTSVTSFLIIAGLLAPKGVSIFEFFGSKLAPCHDLRGQLLYPTDPPGPSYWFYNDCPPAVAVECTNTLKPMAWSTHTGIVPFAGHEVVPTRYMLCERDNILPVEIQKMFIVRAKKDVEAAGKGGSVAVDVVEKGHSPWLSEGGVELVGGWIRKYGGGEKVDLLRLREEGI